MLRKIALWLRSTAIYNFFTFKILPKLDIGCITGHRVKDKHIEYLSGQLKKGDLLLSTNTKGLTQYFISGEWSHVGFYLGPELGVLEMVGTGIRRVPLEVFMSKADKYKHCRVYNWDEDYVDDMIQVGLTFLDAHVPYDKYFEAGTKAMYCAELIYFMDFEMRAGFKLRPLPLIEIDGILPDEILLAPTVDVISSF